MVVSECFDRVDLGKKFGKNFIVFLGSQECKQPESNYEFPYVVDMLKYIKAHYGDHFEICVAGFPYKHPESKNLEDDMKFLKQKVR